MLFSSIALLFSASLALAAPVPAWKREVPQEHSHEDILRIVNVALKLDNPDEIQDAVFGLLGNAAASKGLGKISDADCLQQATADRAFTNAINANDIDSAVAALIFRTLERNTGSVGLKSVLCTAIQAVNPEIAILTQHQDPASDNAAAENKAIVLELAKQIASIGGNPLDALKSGTFAPGEIGDPTAAGNTCDDANDANGCINTLNRLVLDASEDEITIAVAGISANSVSNNNSDNAGAETVTVTVTVTADSADATANATDCPETATVTVAAAAQTAAPAEVADAPAKQDDAAQAVAGGNLQKFTGALGGLPPSVEAGGRGFVVENNADFLNLSAALGRSCDVQHNKCANAANAGADFEVADCETQNSACRAGI